MARTLVPLSKVVLLVDDDAQHVEVLGVIMRLSGFSVLSFSDPAEALSKLAQIPEYRIDIAILDYEMPLINGCALAHYLRACYPILKIIVYSGTVGIDPRELSRVDAFVRKGDGVKTLLQQISDMSALKPEVTYDDRKPTVTAAY